MIERGHELEGREQIGEFEKGDWEKKETKPKLRGLSKVWPGRNHGKSLRINA